MERTTAIFHERDQVDRAVTELSERGIDEANVFIERALSAAAEGGRPKAGGLSHRLLFAGAGGFFGALLGLAVSGPPGGTAMDTIWLVLFFALAGIFAGGVIGLAVGGFRRETWQRHVAWCDWTVRVDTHDPDETSRAREVLRRLGGDLRAPA
jgi:hypothetical protein